MRISGGECARAGQTEHPALLRHSINPEAVFALRSFDRQRQTVGEFGDRAGMIDVPVCDQDLLQRDALGLDCAQYARDVAARIDQRCTLRLLAPEEAAVLLERRDRDDLVFHGLAGRRRRREGASAQYSRAAISPSHSAVCRRSPGDRAGGCRSVTGTRERGEAFVGRRSLVYFSALSGAPKLM